MSNQLMILPLLDGMVLDGIAPDSSGSFSFPVLHEASGTKLYVKKISVPETATNTDALLLAGVIHDRNEADEYYTNEVNEIRAELSAFASLSKSEYITGFLRYQVQPKEGTPGFDVYLLSRRMLSLPEYLKQNAITNEDAVSLAENLCLALSDIRSAGYYHRNLKPSNIFFDKGKFCIGDLGLIAVEASCSSNRKVENLYYSAPEASTTNPVYNDSSDLYSVGMVLYYIYNGNHLPFNEAGATLKSANLRRIHGEELPSPMYADYEMGKIILKACAVLPEDRYHSPAELLEDIRSYQNHIVFSPEPLVPPIVLNDLSEETDYGRSTKILELPEEAEDTPTKTDFSNDSFVESFTPAKQKAKKNRHGGIISLIVFAILLLASAGAAFYYFSYSAITVTSIEAVDHGVDYITVNVDSNNYELLSITCKNDAGYSETRICTSSQTFSGLSESGLYEFQVEPVDWHYMKGVSQCTGSTSGYTEITDFTVEDLEDGTACVRIQVSGPEPISWVICVDDGEGFTTNYTVIDHECIISEIEVGKNYVLSIAEPEGYFLSNHPEIEFSRDIVVTATSLTVEPTENGSIIVSWTADSDFETQWSVVCSGSKGYAESVTTKEYGYEFINTPASADYTITLTNDSMAAPLIETCRISAGEVSNLKAQETDSCLSVTWDFSGPAEPDKWILTYNCESLGISEDVELTEKKFDLNNYVSSAEYSFTISAADDAMIDGETTIQMTTATASKYEQHDFGGVYAVLFNRPSETWTAKELYGHKSVFSPDAYLVLCIVPGYKPQETEEEEKVLVQLVIRDENGNAIGVNSKETTYNELWEKPLSDYMFAYDIQVPNEEGSYTVELYFNLGYVCKKSFTVS